LDLAFRALASPVRRGILGALHDWGGEMRSSVIAARFDIPWQGVSRHLRILTEAGLVRCRELKNGRLYSIDEDSMRSIVGRWISRVATPGRWNADGQLVHEFDE
jgi:DNA-binding transcriptional ArsR family regulator